MCVCSLQSLPLRCLFASCFTFPLSPSLCFLFLRLQCNWGWRGLWLKICLPLAKNSLELQRNKAHEKPKGFHPTLYAFSSLFSVCVCNIIGAWLWNDFILYNFVLDEKLNWWRKHEKQCTESRQFSHASENTASEGKLTHYQLGVIYSWAEFDWLNTEEASLRALLTDSFLLLSSSICLWCCPFGHSSSCLSNVCVTVSYLLSL